MDDAMIVAACGAHGLGLHRGSFGIRSICQIAVQRQSRAQSSRVRRSRAWGGAIDDNGSGANHDSHSLTRCEQRHWFMVSERAACAHRPMHERAGQCPRIAPGAFTVLGCSAFPNVSCGFNLCPTCVQPVSTLCPTCVQRVSHLCQTYPQAISISGVRRLSMFHWGNV